MSVVGVRVTPTTDTEGRHRKISKESILDDILLCRLPFSATTLGYCLRPTRVAERSSRETSSKIYVSGLKKSLTSPIRDDLKTCRK